MANGIKDLRNLPLHDLIGAPMVAIVEAEAAAARATVEFIEKVGFSPANGGANQPEALDIGPLRMAHFQYQKLDENGEQADFIAQVPVLSLVPIPGVRVKQAKIAFTAKISDVYEEDAKSSQTDKQAVRSSWLKPSLTKLRGGVAASSDPSGSRQTRGNFEIQIEIELESMPLASGLEKILNLMDQAIHDEQQ